MDLNDLLISVMTSFPHKSPLWETQQKRRKMPGEEARRKTLEQQRHREIDETWLASLPPEARSQNYKYAPRKAYYRSPDKALSMKLSARRFRNRRGGDPVTGVERLRDV